MAYLFLTVSIVTELIGTSMLKASAGFTKPLPAVIALLSFGCSFFFLSLTLKAIPLNQAYAIWSGIGAVATTLISVLIWKERINAASIVGIGFIITGVVVLNLMGPGHDSAEAEQRNVPEVRSGS